MSHLSKLSYENEIFWVKVEPLETPFKSASERRCYRRFLLFEKENITETRLLKYTENFPPKHETFQIKKSDIFHISAEYIDWWYSLEPHRWGGSNKYPQSMILSRNKKINVYPIKPQFHCIKVGFKGVKTI